jgi:hypothetical protein
MRSWADHPEMRSWADHRPGPRLSAILPLGAKKAGRRLVPSTTALVEFSTSFRQNVVRNSTVFSEAENSFTM